VTTTNPFDSAFSREALDALTEHYDLGANLYKFWASPRSVLRAIVLGWARANHPSHLHYAWDLERAPSLDFGILETTRQAIELLDLHGREHPLLFEPGCGIGGGVTQVAAMLPHATVVGVSLVEKQLEIGRAIARARGLSNTAFVHANYLATPFPDDHFDGSFAIETLIYVPNPEKPALFREFFRVLKPGATFVSFDGVRLRDAQTATEQRYVQDVMDGWTMALPPTPREFQDAARAAGFLIEHAEHVTDKIYESARRIARIATLVLGPLSRVARVPLLGALVRPFGFESPKHAARFVDACLSQLKVFEEGLGGYYVHVLRKPA
jgi:cyclopropane fatty-acyl-phospholipid synthase-like methyltransferase